jgi:3-oxo-5-alpha-steroid 4-dehydrogenase 1
MTSVTLFDALVLAWIALAVGLVPLQLMVTAPYGRHTRPGWGPRIPNRLGWFAMEIVSPVVFAALFLSGPTTKSAPMWVFFALWVAHYVHRSLIFPWRMQTHGKTIPLLIVASAAAFNIVNGGLNGYPPTWLTDPRFVIGAAVFVAGAIVNIRADHRLIALRGAADYAIPRGPLFEWVSCPNHLGEIVQWFGFALMCWNLPALSFAIWTAANLLPRSLSHHKWYLARFADYPRPRKALIPFIL